MGGTLRWYYNEYALQSIDCRSEVAARALAKALVLASEREIRRFQWLFVEADFSESVTEWTADEVTS